MLFTDVALRRAADAIDSMNDAFAAVDHDWRVVAVNRKQESLFRRPRTETLGRIFWEVFPDSAGEVGFFSEVRRAASEGVVVEFEEYYGVLDAWLECRACPREGGLDIFLRDVTARRRSEEQRPATRRRDEVLGIVAHDLRNHLNTIRASSKVALVLGDRSPRRPIETIERASERMERLIRDLLDVSAIECGTLAIDPAPVSPVGLLSEAIDAHAAASAEQGIGLSLDCDGELPEIAADFQRLLQILGNLLGNAIKFTPRGGQIVVGARHDGAAGPVRFWVSDTGQGIPRDQFPHIFNKFNRRRARPQDGVGLGLAICKAIVDAHGGRIWAERGDPSGTTVCFTMPIDDAQDSRARRMGAGCSEHQRGSEESC
jgi:sigma-B regulation protein RsbU (phosphoserine phosphatase)